MSRYIIIDTNKMTFSSNFGEASIPITTINSSCMLSEEESLAKFKEIWDAGVEHGYDVATEAPDWNEFKKEL